MVPPAKIHHMTAPRPITSRGEQAWLGSSANHMAVWAGPRQHSEHFRAPRRKHFRALHVSSRGGGENTQREQTAQSGEREGPGTP